MTQEASLEEVFDTVAKARKDGRKVSLLIGAGCSVTAGIPVASAFVEQISIEFPNKYEAVRKQLPEGRKPSYQQCMARLAPSERRQLMAGHVDKARINWAHIGIACLIQASIVDRVLTVNFDPLVIRACALLNEFPGVYDFASSQKFDASHVAERAVFYLHGQQSGFVHLHTEDQVEAHSALLKPVFDDAGRNRLWIVVGYSGENDPVIENLAKLDSFTNGLYWIARPGTSPPKNVANDLLGQTKSGYQVECAGADEFFIQLAQRMDCFPPPIFATPFTHLEAVYRTLVDKFPSLSGGATASAGQHPLTQSQDWIAKAIKQFETKGKKSIGRRRMEKPTPSDASFVLERYLAGDYDAVISKYESDLGRVPKEAKENVCWSFIGKGNKLSDEATTKTGAEADRLFALAGEKYAAALVIKPDMHEALNNWGIALKDQAKAKTGAEADRLFTLAGEKYAAALVIKPDKYEALCNWGITLKDQAKAKTGVEADRLFTLAGEKYAAALVIKPDMHEALSNWGIALKDQAKAKTGAEADRLFTLAGEKYAAALVIKPDKYEALSNWGVALADQARTKTGAEADRLFTLAGEKYAAALVIKPDMHEALSNWGIALKDQAKAKTGAEADRLFTLAGEKYTAALVIKPDKHDALNNWGVALADQARTKTGAEADRLFTLAGEKYAAALVIKPDKYEALCNWGIALLEQAQTKTGAEADRLFDESDGKYARASSLVAGCGDYDRACIRSLRKDFEGARKYLDSAYELGALPDRAHLSSDSDLDALRDLPWFQELLAKAK